MLGWSIAMLTASVSLGVTGSPPIAALDSIGVPRSRVPIQALKAIDAFIATRKLLPEADADPAHYRQREIGQRTYFIGDFDVDGTRDVAVLYDLQISQADRLWLLYAMGPGYRNILHAQIGTVGRGRSRYVKFRGLRGGSFEFDTMYYEPGAPMCCPSVPGRARFGYEAGDIVEDGTEIDWAKRRPPGE